MSKKALDEAENFFKSARSRFNVARHDQTDPASENLLHGLHDYFMALLTLNVATLTAVDELTAKVARLNSKRRGRTREGRCPEPTTSRCGPLPVMVREGGPSTASASHPISSWPGLTRPSSASPPSQPLILILRSGQRPRHEGRT